MTLGGPDVRRGVRARYALGIGCAEVDGPLVVRDVDALGLGLRCYASLERRRGDDRGRCESANEGCNGELHVGRFVSESGGERRRLILVSPSKNIFYTEGGSPHVELHTGCAVRRPSNQWELGDI